MRLCPPPRPINRCWRGRFSRAKLAATALVVTCTRLSMQDDQACPDATPIVGAGYSGDSSMNFIHRLEQNNPTNPITATRLSCHATKRRLANDVDRTGRRLAGTAQPRPAWRRQFSTTKSPRANDRLAELPVFITALICQQDQFRQEASYVRNNPLRPGRCALRGAA